MEGRFHSVAAACAALSLFAAGCCASHSCASSPVAGRDRPLKVLMIGNSFSICVLRQLPQCAASAGVKLDLASMYIGGCSFALHASNVVASANAEFRPYGASWHYDSLDDQSAVPFAAALDDERKKGNLLAMLAGDKWDVVTIQQASHQSWRPESYHPHAETVIAAVRKYAPQAEIRIQQTWSYCKLDGRICDPKTGGAGSWGFDRRGMYERLKECYDDLARTHGFKQIPMGDAVEAFRAARHVDGAEGDVVGTARDGKKVDSIHLNKNGHYLQACVWLGALFGVDPRTISYAPEGMAVDLAKDIREAAAKANFGCKCAK